MRLMAWAKGEVRLSDYKPESYEPESVNRVFVYGTLLTEMDLN